MDADELSKAKRAVMARYRHAGSSNLQGLVLDLSYALDQSPLLHVVRVKKTGDPASLIEAQCRPASPPAAATALLAELRRVWLDEVLLPPYHRDAGHAASTSATAVALEFVVVEGTGRYYITGRLTVDLRTTLSKRGKP